MQYEQSQVASPRLTRPAPSKERTRHRARDWALSIGFAALLVAAIFKAEHAGPGSVAAKPAALALVEGHDGGLALAAGEYRDRLSIRDAAALPAPHPSTGDRATR